MTYDTISGAQTNAGDVEETLLAGRYRVVRQLGQGGMGSVWLAEDTLLDGKLFAIKMLPAILAANKRAYRQLKDEAIVAMRLTHPNIVTLRAFEENNGTPFLVMDYIDGQTLDDYLAEYSNRVAMSGADVLRILRPIAAALDYAHSKGVIHRDVKPSNVMIAKDGTPYILDFGIAREIQETMTRVTGKLSSGTLLYMSPEQLMGAQPKPAQDVYSFAAMVYECLKGEPPFAHGQIEFQIMNKQPDPLPTEVLTGKAAILAAGVMAGLAKKPEDRPVTCAAVLEGSGFNHVEHVEGVDGGNGRVPSPSESSGGWWKPLLAMATFVLAFFGAWWLSDREAYDVEITDVPPVEQNPIDVVGMPAPTEPAGASTSAAPASAAAPASTALAPAARVFPANPVHKQTHTITLPGGATMEMIYCGPGDYVYGDDNTPMHMDHGFWLGKYEVTQKQWKSVMRGAFVDGMDVGDPSSWKGENLPVENVSWNDCQEFVRRVDTAVRRQLGGGARLPTEHEWEYACRAGTTSKYSWGYTLNGVQANCRGTNPEGTEAKGPYLERTTPVGSYEMKGKNNWGFCDMHGNVGEWCEDRYNASGDNRVLRGGSWSFYAECCAASYRFPFTPSARKDIFGFRLCCSAEPSE